MTTIWPRYSKNMVHQFLPLHPKISFWLVGEFQGCRNRAWLFKFFTMICWNSVERDGTNQYFERPPSSHVTLCHFFSKSPPSVSFTKTWETTSWNKRRFFLYMVAEAYHIISKDVEKVNNCTFSLFAHSILCTNTQLLTNHVEKMEEL